MRHAEPTTSTRTTTRRTSYSSPCAQDYIDARRTFTANSLRATLEPTSSLRMHTIGQLPAEWVDVLRDDAASAGLDAQVYVVWSYRTPIAWQLPDGTTRIPAVRYSNTTSRHQHATRMGLDTYVHGDGPGTGWQNTYADTVDAARGVVAV